METTSTIYEKVDDLIGNTPIVRLKNLGVKGNILAKLEMQNPLGSVKDRIAKAMIEAAENAGILKAGGVIVEATSGNTGIALAGIGAAKGYRVILVMPETMSLERQNLLRALGAEVELTPAHLQMQGSIEVAEKLCEKIQEAVPMRQFDNPANPDIHRRTTAIEILEVLGTDLDYLVVAVGTGGTLTGVGEVLKKEIPGIQIIAVEPEDSAVLSGKPPGPHRIQGIGPGFVPSILNRALIDEVITARNEEAFQWTENLARKEGLLCGLSSGAAVSAAVKLSKRAKIRDKKILVILPDTGERYQSMGLFQNQDGKSPGRTVN